MKREELKALVLTDEQVNAVMKLYGISIVELQNGMSTAQAENSASIRNHNVDHLHTCCMDHKFLCGFYLLIYEWLFICSYIHMMKRSENWGIGG